MRGFRFPEPPHQMVRRRAPGSAGVPPAAVGVPPTERSVRNINKHSGAPVRSICRARRAAVRPGRSRSPFNCIVTAQERRGIVGLQENFHVTVSFTVSLLSKANGRVCDAKTSAHGKPSWKVSIALLACGGQPEGRVPKAWWPGCGGSQSRGPQRIKPALAG